MHFSINRNRPPTGDGMARLSETPPRGARSRPKAKGILLSTGIARLLARNGPPVGDAGSGCPFAAEGQMHSSLSRNRPPTSDGMARLSETPPRGARSRPKAKKSILLSTGIARLLARHDPPLGHPARRSFAAKGQNAFLYQQESPAYWRRNGPPVGDAGSGCPFAAEGEKKHSSLDRNRPLAGTA